MKTEINQSLKVLGELTSTAARKSTRLLSFLKEPDSSTPNWAYGLSPSFNEALDIKLTDRVSESGKGKVWTQGANFNFKPGDVIHSACGTRALQVTESGSATQTDEYSLDGCVRYDAFEIRDGKYSKVAGGHCSQVDFVRKLIQG